MTADELFWDLAEPLCRNPAITRSTMMGLACVRVHGQFFASLDRDGRLIVKLPEDRVAGLIDSGIGQPFAPSGRRFRQWVAIKRQDPERWQALLEEAMRFISGEN